MLLETDHDLPEMPTAAKMIERVGELIETVTRGDRGTRAVESEGTVHCLIVLPTADLGREGFNPRRDQRDQRKKYCPPTS